MSSATLFTTFSRRLLGITRTDLRMFREGNPLRPIAIVRPQLTHLRPPAMCAPQSLLERKQTFSNIDCSRPSNITQAAPSGTRVKGKSVWLTMTKSKFLWGESVPPLYLGRGQCFRGCPCAARVTRSVGRLLEAVAGIPPAPPIWLARDGYRRHAALDRAPAPGLCARRSVKLRASLRLPDLHQAFGYR